MNDCYYQVDPSLHIFVFCAATCMHRTVISPVKRSTFESATLSEALNRPLKSVASLGVLRPLALAPSQCTSPSDTARIVQIRHTTLITLETTHGTQRKDPLLLRLAHFFFFYLVALSTSRIMDSRTDDSSLNGSSEGSCKSIPTGSQSTTEGFVQQYRQCLWPACSIVSVLSARCLLIEQSFHYPVHLYISQIVAMGVFALCLHSCRRKSIVPNERARWGRFSAQATQLMAATYCLVAMAMFCALQSIMHFTNLPVLIMLTVRKIRLQRLASLY